jgi:protein-disulfide isomerase
MRKLIPFLLLLGAVALAGCLPQTQATVPTATETKPVQPTPTSVLQIPTQAVLLPDSGCTVVAKNPTSPTAEPGYPPITDQDWTKGPADAKVTIVEYSDFQ